MQTILFSQLSGAGQVLMRLCQRVNYGCVLNVHVRNGDVCFDEPPEASVDLRLDSEYSPRLELGIADFALPIEVRRLVDQLEALGNGVIEKIVVHDGIPRRVILRKTFREASHEST